MELDRRPGDGTGEGCLAGVVRIPVKIVAVLVVLPVRVVWDLLAAGGRAARRHVLAPLGAALVWVYERTVQPVLRALGRVLLTLLKLVFVWPWAGLWRYVLAPAGRAGYAYLLAPVGRFLLTYVLRPLGEALRLAGSGAVRWLLAPLGKGLLWIFRMAGTALFVWPWVGLWRYVLTPLGHGLVGLAQAVYAYVLTPVGRYVLRPLGLALARAAAGVHRWVLRPVGEVLVWAWHVAGRILCAVGRGLRRVARVLWWPVARVYRHVLMPAGHLVREIWRTARTAVREVRADLRRVLFGAPPGEPARSRARTLGSTTAAGNAPAPETPLHRRG